MERTWIPRLWHGVHMRAMICSKACVLHVCVAPALHCLDEFGVLAHLELFGKDGPCSRHWIHLNTGKLKWIKDEGTPQHTPTIEPLSSFYFQMFTMTWCIWFTHVSKSHQSSAHKGRQDLLSVSYQPLSKLRMSLRLPGFHNIHAMIRWMLIWLSYAHDTHL